MEKYKNDKVLKATEHKKPPINPSHVLFGEIEGKNSFFPKRLPKIYAKELLVQINVYIKSVVKLFCKPGNFVVAKIKYPEPTI